MEYLKKEDVVGKNTLLDLIEKLGQGIKVGNKRRKERKCTFNFIFQIAI